MTKNTKIALITSNAFMLLLIVLIFATNITFNFRPSILQNKAFTCIYLAILDLLVNLALLITFNQAKSKKLNYLGEFNYIVLISLMFIFFTLIMTSYFNLSDLQVQYGMFFIVFMLSALINFGVFILLDCFEEKLMHVKLFNKLIKYVNLILKIALITIVCLVFSQSNIWYLYLLLFIFILSKISKPRSAYKKQLE